MKYKILWILLFAVVLGTGAFFRLWRLDSRPMHTDEAVHAEKFGALLEEGSYLYNPVEFHGPTLNYLTLISAWVRGEKTYADISEITLRIIPALFGVALILTPLFFIRCLGVRAAALSSILIAFSPAFVYYSRYYIMEVPLVFFSGCFLGALWKYHRCGKLPWLVVAGIFVGLMHSTKETFLFTVLAAMIAMVISIFLQKQRSVWKVTHVLWALLAMGITSAIWHSSFGANPKGVWDSIVTFDIWARRAGGASVHIHPWYYYLNLLTWFEFVEPLTWNEDGIVGFALLGLFLAFSKTSPVRFTTGRFIACFTFILTVIYCLIPYKTPWCMLSFLYGMTLLAGFAMDRILHNARRLVPRIILWLVVIIYGVTSPVFQSWMLNFKYTSDTTNPYVYAHTDTDVYKMVETVKEALAASDQGKDTLVMVVAEGNDYWPLPWYFRDYNKVGFLDHMDISVCTAPIILANAELEHKLLNVLYTVPKPGHRNMYMPLFEDYLYLRPGVEWRGYIRKDLWDQMQEKSQPQYLPQPPKESILESKPDKKEIAHLLKSSHTAMNANFEIFIQHEDGKYAARAARAAFNEVDRLENLLSRFVDNSDVSRINALKPGEFTVVDEDTIECLRIAQKGWQITDGAFDVTIGKIIEAWKTGRSDLAESLLAKQPNMQMLEFDEGYAVKMLGEDVSVDLGGIGKGYAVDKIAEVLKEWGIERALIHGAASSVKALAPPEGKQGWVVTLTNPLDGTTATRLELANEVLSCSGLQQGKHIINPFTGQAVTDRRACWIRTNASAALADALTTAGMIMPLDDLKKLQAEQSGDMEVMLLVLEPDGKGKLVKFGNWPTD